MRRSTTKTTVLWCRACQPPTKGSAELQHEEQKPPKGIARCPASASSSSTRRHCCRKRRSAVGAIHVRGGHHVLALRTAGAQLVAAVRADVEATLDEAPALWACAA